MLTRMLSSPASSSGFQYMGQAGVGVHVDGAIQGLFPDQADGRADNPGRHERVAFAALAEADHAVLTRCDVRQGDAGDLFGRRGEGDAVLAAGQCASCCREMQPRQRALQAREVGRGASYRPRKKFLPAGQP
jgi:hypothetical protein